MFINAFLITVFFTGTFMYNLCHKVMNSFKFCRIRNRFWLCEVLVVLCAFLLVLFNWFCLSLTVWCDVDFCVWTEYICQVKCLCLLHTAMWRVLTYCCVATTSITNITTVKTLPTTYVLTNSMMSLLCLQTTELWLLCWHVPTACLGFYRFQIIPIASIVIVQ